MKLTVNKRLRNTALLKNIPKLLLQQSPTDYTQSKVEKKKLQVKLKLQYNRL